MAAGLSAMDMLRFAGSLVLVLGLLGGLLWALKRMQTGVRPGGTLRQLQVIEAVSVGPRQKVALVRVGTREVLVGISPAQITALGSWPAAEATKDTHEA
jgi:flagellar protein FliO/FliZ